MVDLELYIVDVFAEKKYAGNQLAVVRNAFTLTSEQMQQIANEMHYSETTFILSDQTINGGYNVRIFTPLNEVPFAGHPTLGTAYILENYVEKTETKKVVLNLGVGQIPVTFEVDSNGQEVLWMNQKAPIFGKIFSTIEMVNILQLKEEEFDTRYPIQEVSTGMPFIVIPLKTLEAVENAKTNIENLQKIAKDVRGGLLIFCPHTYHKENDLNVRVFVDLYGIPEDPATGSGNGCLAAYLSQYRYFGSDKVNVRVEQGFAVRRPSILLLQAQISNDEIDVRVGGKVVPVAVGKLL